MLVFHILSFTQISRKSFTVVGISTNMSHWLLQLEYLPVMYSPNSVLDKTCILNS